MERSFYHVARPCPADIHIAAANKQACPFTSAATRRRARRENGGHWATETTIMARRSEEIFARREDLFATPEHHRVTSDSVPSPLASAFSAAGGLPDEWTRPTWLRMKGFLLLLSVWL